MHYTITIHHDPTCAWCYISHKTLFHALSLFTTTYPNAKLSTYTITWSPFYRDPTAPSPSIPTWDLMIARNGIVQAQGIKKRMHREGRAVGIAFALKGRVGKTRDFARVGELVKLEAGEEGMKGFVEGVYRGFFEGDEDVTDVEFLVREAGKVGVREGRVRGVLGGDEFGEVVDRMDRGAREEGVKAVPTTVVNGVRVEGAEDVQGWYEVFVKASEAI